MEYFKWLLLPLIFFIIARSINADSQVVINEILIEPSPQSIELLNYGSQNVDISHWYIDDNGGTTYFTVPDNTIIQPNTCIVFSGEFNLNKSSPDTIRFFDSSAPPVSASAKLIDSYNYKVSPGTGISFIRFPDASASWSTGSADLGYFNGTNNSCIATILPTIIPVQLPSPAPSPTHDAQSKIINGVVISEVLPYPDSSEHEWVELYNSNDFAVDLEDWFIDDGLNSGSSPQVFSITIPGKSYKTVALKSAMFNNSGDTVRLLNTEGLEKAAIIYNESLKNLSWGSTDLNQDSFCFQLPSPEQPNNPCLSDNTPTPQPLNAIISSIKKSSGSTLGVSSIHRSPQGQLTPKPYTQLASYGNTVENKSEDQQYFIPDEMKQPNLHYNRLIKSLSFASISFSLLSIAVILIKIKSNLF